MTISPKGGKGKESQFPHEYYAREKIYEAADGTECFSIEIYHYKSTGTLTLTFHNLSDYPATLGYQFLDETNSPLMSLIEADVPPHSQKNRHISDEGNTEYLIDSNYHGHGAVQGRLEEMVTARRNGFKGTQLFDNDFVFVDNQ